MPLKYKDPLQYASGCSSRSEFVRLKREGESEQEYESNSATDFKIQKNKVTQQFSHLYFTRLKSMSCILQPTLKRKSSKNYPLIDKILDIKNADDCIIVGTLYKEMKLKPNILLEYTKESFMDNSNIPIFASDECKVSNNDMLILEDVHGRVRLTFIDVTKMADLSEEDKDKQKQRHQQKVNQLMTGMVVGVAGRQLLTGDFLVDEIILPGIPPQKPLSSTAKDSGRYVGIISGLSVAHPEFNPLSMQLLVDFLCGVTGNDEEQKFCSKISRLIIAGNSVCPPENNSDLFNVRGSLRPREYAPLVEPMKSFDSFLEQIASVMHIDVMPGDADPSNPSLPQQPIHHSMLPKSSKYASVHAVRNPHSFKIHNVAFLGHSGQPVDDIKKYSSLTSAVEILECTLKAAHIAPTAPDTLDCYPFTDRDPFIIEESPNIYFAANQPSFECKLVKGEDHVAVQCVSVPSFVKCPVLVLVDLQTLDCFPVSFQV